MSIRFVLFDLDGTLLPMDQEVFVRAYVKGLAEKLAPLGFVPEQVIQGLWAGTGAMIQNDGSLRNEEVFWKTFCGIVGENILEYQDLIDSYYRNEFQAVQQVCGFAPQAAQVIASLRDRGSR